MSHFRLFHWRRASVFVLWAAPLAILMSSSPAFAALGESYSTPLATAAGSSSPNNAPAPFKKATYTLYAAHSSTLENGTVITEYTTNGAVVFAVSWAGPSLPDLSNLLGRFFPIFKSEVSRARNQRNVGTPLRIESAEFVLLSGGRMGNFAGHAFVPTLVPAGLEIKDVLP